MSLEQIRIAGREGVLNKSADSWQIITHPTGAARAFGFLLAAFPALGVAIFSFLLNRDCPLFKRVELALIGGITVSVSQFY